MDSNVLLLLLASSVTLLVVVLTQYHKLQKVDKARKSHKKLPK